MTETIIDMKNRVSTIELETIVRHQIKQLKHNPQLASKLPPLMVWGAPGVGKSSILRSIAEDLGIGFIDVRLAQREPIDIRGLPVPTEDGIKWLVSSDWPRDQNSQGIILFDELTAADRSLQVAAYEFILDRRIGELYHVPDGWYICGAGNRVEDRAVSMTMSSALSNRFLHVELQEDSELWVQWGLKNSIHPSVLGFIRFRPNLLFHQENENLERGWPTPRSWERVSWMLQTFDSDNSYLLNKLIYGLIGNQAGVEFIAYLQISREFDNLYEFMINPKSKIIIPDKVDIRYAFCLAAVYHLWRGKSKEEEALLIDGFYRVSLAMPSDFAAMMMIDAMQGNERVSTTEYTDKLYNHPKYKDWAKKHGTAFKARMNRKAMVV